jgi:hypothetical protein
VVAAARREAGPDHPVPILVQDGDGHLDRHRHTPGRLDRAPLRDHSDSHTASFGARTGPGEGQRSNPSEAKAPGRRPNGRTAPQVDQLKSRLATAMADMAFGQPA